MQPTFTEIAIWNPACSRTDFRTAADCLSFALLGAAHSPTRLDVSCFVSDRQLTVSLFRDFQQLSYLVELAPIWPSASHGLDKLTLIFLSLFAWR